MGCCTSAAAHMEEELEDLGMKDVARPSTTVSPLAEEADGVTREEAEVDALNALERRLRSEDMLRPKDSLFLDDETDANGNPTRPRRFSDEDLGEMRVDPCTPSCVTVMLAQADLCVAGPGPNADPLTADSTHCKTVFYCRAEPTGDSINTMQQRYYGRAKVFVPDAGDRGGERLSAANYQLWDRMTTLALPEYGEADESAAGPHFVDAFDMLSKLDNQSVLLYVHGHNVTFKGALLTAAHLAMDAQWTGLTTMYSWQTGSSFTDYQASLANEKATRDSFVQYVLDVVEQLLFRRAKAAGSAPRPSSARGKVHIVTHSLGCRLVLKAFKQIAQTHPSVRPYIGQTILVAPDLSQGDYAEIMTSETGPQADFSVGALPDAITLYYSDSDFALAFSAVPNYMSGKSRVVGRWGPPPLDLPDVDLTAVDCSERAHFLDSFFGAGNHSYYLNDSANLDDTKLILRGVPPRARSKKGGTLLTMADDESGRRFALRSKDFDYDRPTEAEEYFGA